MKMVAGAVLVAAAALCAIQGALAWLVAPHYASTGLANIDWLGYVLGIAGIAYLVWGTIEEVLSARRRAGSK